MKRKTIKKLLRKLSKLPVYHVDTSVFIEDMFNQSRAQCCRTLFQISGRKHILKVSSIVLGEVIKVINKEKEEIKRKMCFEYLDITLSRRNIIIYTPTSKVFLKYIPEIYETDSFLQSMDLLNVASAIEDKAQRFIAFDSDLNNNKVLEKRFKIKFTEP